MKKTITIENTKKQKIIFTLLSATTQQAQHFTNDYFNSNYENLYNCYGHYSKDKAIAFENCRTLKADLNGDDGRIFSACVYQFNYGFKINYNNKKYLIVITRTNKYLITL